MPVILTTAEERHLDARFLGRGQGAAATLPDEALKIVMRGADKEDKLAA